MRLLSRAALQRYGLVGIEEASPTRLRELAQVINEARRGEGGAPIHAGELGALLVLQDVLADEVARSLREEHPQALEHALAALEAALGRPAVDELLAAVLLEFGSLSGGGREPTATTLDPRARLAALEALLVLWHFNRNPALAALRELFDDRRLPVAHYGPAIRVLEADLRQTTAAPNGQRGDLIDRLDASLNTAPRSIAAQLSYWLERRATPERAGESPGVPRQRLERSLDALREETVRLPPGPGPIEVPELAVPAAITYHGPPRAEPRWMSEVVLGAKHTFVWLDQLSRARGRPIERLDEVPDEALAELAKRGLNGLWLVGVWERSPASRRIKRLTGDDEAQASAYSIFDYRVAEELGGDAALADLQERALAQGVRLGVDVVPNHFGLDSRWLRDHPERFLAVEHCPFPGYTFAGPDLSADPDIGVYLEDHYYDRSDAAVVFRHVDRRTGRERFIYHGNDGTSTPWNDTAQLDYSLPDVRAAMGDLIVDLARRYRILRFDAAMTLTRMHFQRLWFPAPGTGGAVPSRSEYGLSAERFARAMPREFWRDVVERVDAEAPDTLLIAEAFWLMEPFFVRQLGMHRVYNSAFMHLLRERQDERMQRLLRDTAARDAEFLRRSVNFMSTPDEASAAEQFGSGDRYFGVCTLLATLPGLPLFGHGQIEGLREQYGMEFQRARTAEAPDPEALVRHQREIAPLLSERARFAGVEGFEILDFIDESEERHLGIYAFHVGSGPDARVVAFNNTPDPVRGRLRLADSAVGGEGEGRERPGPLLGVTARGRPMRWRDVRFGAVVAGSAVARAEGELPLELAAWQALVLRPLAGRGRSPERRAARRRPRTVLKQKPPAPD
jgi:hypothetical protein